MSQEHAATLLNLTGDLFPAGDTPAEQLSEVRRLLLAALLGAETPADLGLRRFAGAPVNGAAEEIAALGDAPPLGSPEPHEENGGQPDDKAEPGEPGPRRTAVWQKPRAQQIAGKTKVLTQGERRA